MRLSAIGILCGLALLAVPQAAAAGERDPRTHIMWFPSDRLWVGALPQLACDPRGSGPDGRGPIALMVRRAVYERRGELIAELRAPLREIPRALDNARACAADAVGAANASAILSATIEPWDTFRGALSACLRSKGQDQALGSMTLWIDTSCNW